VELITGSYASNRTGQLRLNSNRFPVVRNEGWVETARSRQGAFESLCGHASTDRGLSVANADEPGRWQCA
jgi:hypothetical protein